MASDERLVRDVKEAYKDGVNNIVYPTKMNEEGIKFYAQKYDDERMLYKYSRSLATIFRYEAGRFYREGRNENYEYKYLNNSQISSRISELRRLGEIK